MMHDKSRKMRQNNKKLYKMIEKNIEEDEDNNKETSEKESSVSSEGEMPPTEVYTITTNT